MSLRLLSPKRQGPREATCLTSPGPWGSGKAHHCLPGRTHSPHRRDRLAHLETLGQAFALSGGSHSSDLQSIHGLFLDWKTFNCQLHSALSLAQPPPLGALGHPGWLSLAPGQAAWQRGAEPGCECSSARASRGAPGD